MADAPCIIGEGIQIRGSLSGSGGLVVRGRIEGQVSLDGSLDIGATGMVVANVEAQRLVVDGQMSGDIDVSELVSLSQNATVVGDIRAPEIEIRDGARFRGKLHMDVPLPDDLD